MCLPPGSNQPFGVNRGVDLRRRQVGVPQQFLNRPEISSRTEKMGGKGVPKRMGRRVLGQAESATQPLESQLHDAR